MAGETAYPYLGAAGNYRDPVVSASRFGFTVEELIASMSGLELLPGGGIVARLEHTGDIRIGQCLTKLSAAVTDIGEAGQWVPRKVTRLAVATTAITTITVDDAGCFDVGDTIGFGDGTTATDLGNITAGENRVISSIAGNVITLTAAAPAGKAIDTYVAAVAVGASTSYCAQVDGIARHRYTSQVDGDTARPKRAVTAPPRGADGFSADGITLANPGLSATYTNRATYGRVAVIIGGMVYKDVLKNYEGDDNLGLIDFAQGGSNSRTITRVRVGASGITT